MAALWDAYGRSESWEPLGRGMGRASAPEAKPRHVAHVGDLRGAGRGEIDDARLGEGLLQLHHRLADRLVVRGALGLVRLVEREHAVEVAPVAPALAGARVSRAAQPRLQLRHPRHAAAARAAVRDQARVGDQEHALLELLRDRAVSHRREALDRDVLAADVVQVALGVDEQVRVAREPHGALAPAVPVLPDDRSELPPLADARAVADEEAGALPRRQQPLVLLQGVDDSLELHAAQHAARERLRGQLRRVGHVRGQHARQAGALHHVLDVHGAVVQLGRHVVGVRVGGGGLLGPRAAATDGLFGRRLKRQVRGRLDRRLEAFPHRRALEDGEDRRELPQQHTKRASAKQGNGHHLPPGADYPYELPAP
eukprot:scaffold40800_cov69-Phaeocystis_antarctica.AAC.2